LDAETTVGKRQISEGIHRFFGCLSWFIGKTGSTVAPFVAV